MAKSKKSEYSAKDIFVLKGLDPVRKRPGMYIGSTGVQGLHHLVWECTDNSLDEAMGGYADEIEINLLPDGYVSVSDNGRGIPVDVHKDTKRSALETVMTTLHAGAKFGKKTYQVSGGLHGVGVSVVCALSSELKAEVWRDGYIYTQEFSKGKAKAKIKKGKKCPKNKTGTKITFKPDKEIFDTLVFERKTILNHLRRQAHLTKGVKIVFRDLRKEDNQFNYVFYFEGGLSSYVKYLCGENEPIHEDTFYVSKMVNDMLVEVAFRYTQERETYEESFANNIFTAEGGSHITGFRTALTRAINEYAKNNDYLKKDEEALNGKDVRIGINAAVSVKLKEPQFEGQTKAKLGNPEAKSAVESVTYEALMEFLERYSSDARAIIQNSLLAAKARRAASAARKTVLRKGMLEGLTLPGKLADCSSKKPEESELFIVEGQSAGGSCKGGRDRKFQAVLPLRGKILNVERAALTRMLTSDEIKALVIALGTAIAQDFDISSLRYHRIIIATDADSVTADTPVFLFNKKTKKFFLTKVGDFINNCDDTSKYQVLSHSSKTGKLELKEILQTIQHPLRTSLYQLKTYSGYQIKVTNCHSVYVYKDSQIITKKASELRENDLMVFPRQFPSPEEDIVIDLRELLLKLKPKNVSLKVENPCLEEIPEGAWIELSYNELGLLKRQRERVKISRHSMEGKIGLSIGAIQQWEGKIDNVMPRASNFKDYLKELNLNSSSLNYCAYVPLSHWKRKINGHQFYYPNHGQKLRTQFKLDKDLAYFIGWFLGDGCASFEKNSPNRFSLALGKEKVENYSKRLCKIIEEKFSAKPIKDIRKTGEFYLTFHSYTFKLILKNLGLLGRKSNEKFIPDIFFNAKKEIKEALLEGLLQSDGFITVWNSTARLGWKLSSRDLIDGIVVLLRQLGIFAGIRNNTHKDHLVKGRLCRSNFKTYTAEVTTASYFQKTQNIWQDHKASLKLRNYLKTLDLNKCKGKRVVKLSEDFVGLRLKKVEEIKNPKDKFVYDFSVLDNQNFIAGDGGMLLHNTDGAHIRTLLLTLFFRYFRPVIEKGYLYIARPPLYKIQSGKRVEYAYTEADKKEILEDIKKGKSAKINIQRYKGLGEMNADQLWDTTMNPENRILLRVTMDDAKEADRIFDTLMGKEVASRKKFIQTHAKSVKNLDI